MTPGDLRRPNAAPGSAVIRGERIPTLEEILEFAKKTTSCFNLELKPSGPGRRTRLDPALARIGEIARRGISFDAVILLVFADRTNVEDRTALRGLIGKSWTKHLKSVPATFHPRRSVTPRLLKEARSRDLQVVWPGRSFLRWQSYAGLSRESFRDAASRLD